MERSRTGLLNVERFSFNGFAASSTIGRSSGIGKWSGRFWLPAGAGVEPTRNFCLLCGDGRVGEMVMERFALRDIGRPVVG